MKSLPIALDKLLSNPSYERVDGKLMKAADDGTRIILELPGKKLRTLLGPFADTEWAPLVDKMIVAFVKEGEVTRAYDAKLLPRDRKGPATTSGATTAPKRATTARKAEVAHAPKVKWKKYAEGRMIGEPVKITNMERGFDLEADLIMRVVEHLGLSYLPVTKSISYMDFRKFFHYICEPAFKAFLSGSGALPPAPQPTAPAPQDDDEA